jgi:hypothetical protein
MAEGEDISFDAIKAGVVDLGVQIKGYHINRNIQAGLLSVTFVIRYKDETLGPRLVGNLSAVPGMINVSWK